VVSPDADFVHQVQSHLEEGGRFQVAGATNSQEALNLANSNFYEVAILDGELKDIPVAAFSRDLSALQADIKILVYPPGNNAHDPSLEGLVTNGFLNKPFSGPEIGGALSKLFSEQPANNSSQVEDLDTLVKQWLTIPENGDQKAGQILSATTAQSALIIIKGESAASAGASDENLIAKVREFLERYWREEDNSELARFISTNGKGSEKFIYATKLVSNVVLVLVYAQTVTLQQVRRELAKVKDDFQKNYPTTGELRQEIANKTLEKVQEQSKTLESMQPFTGAISQSELDALSALKEPDAPTTTTIVAATTTTTTSTAAISQDELDELNKLLSAMPAPDPSPEIEEADEEGKQPAWLDELQKAGVAIPEGEAGSAAPAPAAENASSSAPPFVETEPAAVPVAEAAAEPVTETASETVSETVPEAAVEQEPAPEPVEPSQPADAAEPLPEIDFKLPWESEEGVEEVEETPSSEENVESPTLTNEKIEPPTLTDDNTASFSEMLNEAISEPVPEQQSEAEQTLEPEPEVEQVPEPDAEQVPEEKPEPEAEASPTPTVENGLAALSEEELEETVPELQDFRFHYTCVLVPDDRNQFLARALSEKLSASLPQFHLAQGWQLTNTTIRPQYLLWSVAVPISVCPHQIIHDIRSLTSAHIFANFPDIARNKTSDDFWSENFLAVSGKDLPPANLISDFVAQVWANQEPDTP